MAYLIAAYAITGAAVLGYALWLNRRRRELRADAAGGGEGPD